MNTWKNLIQQELDKHGEQIIYCTLSEDELNKPFQDNYHFPKGQRFTAWSQSRVIFPVFFDGYEGVMSVPRQPSSEVTEHIGWIDVSPPDDY